MNLPIFITVAPLLFWGIWLILIESENLINRGKISERRKILLLLAIVGGIGLFVTRRNSLPPLFATMVIVLAYTLRARELESKRARKFQETIDAQLPAVIQILTILISSGLSPIRALDVIAKDSNSEIGSEFATIVSEVRRGNSITQSLDVFANRIDSALTRRFATTLILGIERGSPLVTVLTDLVRDSRNESKNALLRRAGKAEIALLVPVVFLILPISILFALWPSFQQLNLSLGI